MQIDLFDVLYPTFKFDKTRPIRAVTTFSGLGFQEMGMDLAEIPFEILHSMELDKWAILSYSAVHTDYLKVRDTYEFPDKEVMVEYLQEKNIGWDFSSNKHSITMSTNEETVKDFYLATILNNNLGDITKVKGSDLEKDIDLFTYSFPCQSLSKAGSGGGLSVETKSGLVYEVLRILHELKEENNLPKVLIMENVVDLVQVNYVDEWNRIALEMESEFSYKHYLQILNAKDYGIAQNRRRVFMVSILGEYNYNFPKPIELKYRLKDYLEDEVDESLYLSLDNLKWAFGNALNKDLKDHYDREKALINKDIAYTISTKQDRRVGDSNFVTDEKEEITVGDFIQKHNIMIPEATDRGFKEAYEGDGIYINRSWQKRGVVQDGMIQTLKANNRDVAAVVKGSDEPLSIRRLSPRETARLMGMQDYQYDKQAQVTSDAQLYKQHGNGIVAQVIGKIIGMMWYESEDELNEVVERNSHTWLEKESK